LSVRERTVLRKKRTIELSKVLDRVTSSLYTETGKAKSLNPKVLGGEKKGEESLACLRRAPTPSGMFLAMFSNSPLIAHPARP